MQRIENLDCFQCWRNNENVRGEKIKLNNPKYCWLYPKNKSKDLNNLLPKFENCNASLYTKCDYYLERHVHEIILRLEKLFKSHNDLTNKEMDIQNQLMDIIWINSQKYLILNGNGLCVKTYPEIISSRYEQEILQELLYNIEKIHNSNFRMSKSLENINRQLIDLKNWCNKLDYKVDSPFILGTYYLKSLSYTLNLIEDLYQYFHTHLSKLKSWAELITPSDPVSIEDYKALIQPCKDYETNVVEYLDSCRCMRSKRFKCREKQT